MHPFQHRQRGPGGPFRYDRGFHGGYDRPPGDASRGFHVYDRGYRPARYDRDYGASRRHWSSYAAALPLIPFGVDPMMGPLGWELPFAHGSGMYGAGPGYGYHRPPTPPRGSPTHGRGGDRALRKWAQRYGYDVEYSIAPRRGPRRP